MRTLVLLSLLAFAVSGCVGGNDVSTDDFVPTCPSWTAFTSTDDDGNSVRPAAHQATILHQWNNTSGPEGQGLWPDEHQEGRPIVPGSPGGVVLRGEYPVDFYELEFDVAFTLDVDAKLTVKTESGRNLLFHDMESGRYTAQLSFPDGTNLTDLPTYRVELSNPSADPAPDGIVLVWDFTPNMDNEAQTNSFFITKFKVFAWFRTCGEP